MEVVGTAKSAAEAMNFLKSTSIILVSIDIQLGFDRCELMSMRRRDQDESFHCRRGCGLSSGLPEGVSLQVRTIWIGYAFIKGEAIGS